MLMPVGQAKMKLSPTRSLGLALVLATTHGCTPASSEPTHEAGATTPAPPSSIPAEPAAPAPATSPEPPAPATAPTPAPLPPVPGFVLYTLDQTIILPLDGSPPTTAAGLWVQDDRVTPPAISHALVLTRSRVDALALPACPCLALAGACEADGVQLRHFDPRTGALLAEQSDDDCACIHLPDEHGFPPFVSDDGRAFEACKGGSDEMIASLVAGRLYTNGWEWNGACYESLSLYDATSYELALVANPPEPKSTDMDPFDCYDLGPAFVARPWPIGHGGEPIELEYCEDYESEIFMLRRGHLWAVRDQVSHADGTRWIVNRPVRPDDCPSINDPCGDPEPFRAIAELDDDEREHWIATDGSMALTAKNHAYALWKPGVPTPISITLPDVDATHDLLGVRVHADVTRLRTLTTQHATLGLHSPRRAAETIETNHCHDLHRANPDGPTTPEPSAADWGEDCYARLRVGHWFSAEGSCLQGLALATEPGTRGALLYNLGRIAEAQGARPQAMEHYRDSLAARPGNATVKQRLARLERAPAEPKTTP